jgi:hypothetical protein
MNDRNVHAALTEEQARQALHQAVEGVHLSPGSWQAVPRRQRRQRRRRVLVVAANLAIVLAVAAALTPAVRGRLAADRPTATTPTAPPSTGPLSPQERWRQAVAPVGPMRVLASGRSNGKQWQFIAYRTSRGFCQGWNYAGNPGYKPGGNPSPDLRTPPLNGGMSCGEASWSGPSLSIGTSTAVDQPILASGTVSKNAAQVRIFLHHRGSPTVVTVKPVGQELGLPFNFYVAVLAGTDSVIDAKTVISKAVAYDRAGRPIAQADLKDQPTVPPAPHP